MGSRVSGRMWTTDAIISRLDLNPTVGWRNHYSRLEPWERGSCMAKCAFFFTYRDRIISIKIEEKVKTFPVISHDAIQKSIKSLF